MWSKCCDGLCRYLMVESEDHESEKDQKTKDMYYTVFKRFSSELVKVSNMFKVIQMFRHKQEKKVHYNNS